MKRRKAPRIQEKVMIPSHSSKVINSNAEVIANELLDKLISLTITLSANNYQQQQLGNFCFKTIKEIANELIKISYLPHDDEVMGSNTSDEIIQPMKPNYDRSAFTLIKCTYDNTRREIRKINVKDRKSKHWSENVSLLKPLQSNCNLVTNSKSGVIEVSSLMNENESRDAPQSIIMKRAKAEPIEIVSYDIDNNNSQNVFEPLNINNLRKEMIDDIAAKEMQMNQMKEKSKLLQETVVAPIEEFNSDKYTFNSKGLVIPNKKDKVKLTAKEEFIFPKITYHSIEEYSKDEQENEERELKDELSNTKKEYRKEWSVCTNNSVAQLGFTMNPFSLRNMSKLSTMNYQMPSDNNGIIAGSNYDIIAPETGVVIKNEANIAKGGNMDFFSKYNRISISDYEKKMQENLMRRKHSCQSTEEVVEEKEKKEPISLQSRNIPNFSLYNGINHLSSSVKNARKPISLLHSLRMKNSLSMITIRLNPESNGLKNTLDELDSMPEFNSTKASDNIRLTPKTIFFKNKMRNMLNSCIKRKEAENDLNEMNKFTSSILARAKKDWGTPINLLNIPSNQTHFLPRKPFNNSNFQSSKLHRILLKSHTMKTFLNKTNSISKSKTK